ncbi:MAG: hypothetical protein AB1521_07325 [Bacteroidota bacterium]
MKKLIFLLFVFHSFVIAQYYNERTTEQSFEQSDLYFNSHYLNTFGMKNFKAVSVGLIDDPFLNVYLNPAIMPDFKDKSTIFYLDFRGDRTEEEVVNNYVMPYYADYIWRPIYDRRWITITRAEPEPTFSFGVLMNPIKDVIENFYVGATYQMLRREEGFYSSPYLIYSTSYLYDSFGNRAEGLADVPIVDRYSAKDEMTTEAHLLSFFTGYKIDDNLSAGLYINTVSHSREGGYLNSNKDDYGNIDNNLWENRNGRDKEQDYSHTDFSAGVMYNFTEKFKAGLKFGVLNGLAEQKLISTDYYKHEYNNTSYDNWSNSYSNSFNQQKWKHDGSSTYLGLNFTYKPDERKTINGYYRYSNGDEDIKNSSVIDDTSNYVSHWESMYNNIQDIHDYNGKSSVKDSRSGTGSRIEDNYEAMINFTSQLTSWGKISAGFYVNKRSYEINTTEPVTVYQYSEYHSKSTGNYNYEYNNLIILEEAKRLEWNYTSDYWTIQIPVVLDFTINQYFGVTLGINRMLKNWNIDEETIAFFSYRKRNENGVINQELDFAERYSPADEKYTENETDIFVKFNADINSEFRINLLVDPELENLFRISQWWLSFEAHF